MSLRVCKLKQRCDTPTGLLKRLQSGTRATPSAGEDVGQEGRSSTAGADAGGAATVENSLEVFHKPEHSLSM